MRFVLSILIASFLLISFSQACSTFDFSCKANAWFKSNEQAAINDLDNQVSDAIRGAERAYSCLKDGALDCVTNSLTTQAQQALSFLQKPGMRPLVLQLAGAIGSDVSDVSIDCAAKSTISIPYSLNFNPDALSISKKSHSFEVCTRPGITLTPYTVGDQTFKFWTSNSTIVSIVELATEGILEHMSPQSSWVGSACSSNFAITVTFGINIAVGASGGPSVGFAVGCSNSKVVFSPIWGWQAGLQTNIAVGAGIQVGYVPSWDMVTGNGLGVGVSGGDAVNVNVLAMSTLPQISVTTKDYSKDITFDIGVYKKTWTIDIGSYPSGVQFTAPKFAGVSFGVGAGAGILPIDGSIVFSSTSFIN